MLIKEYKVTFWKQLPYLLITFFFLIMCCIEPVYIIKEFPGNSLFWIYVISFGVFALFNLPLFILYAKYYSLNKHLIMWYDSEGQKITIKNRKLKTETVFTLDDIKYVFHTKSGSGLMPWNNYSYTEIYLKNGKKFIVTCLLASKLKLPVGEKYESTTVNYPYPKGY